MSRPRDTLDEGARISLPKKPPPPYVLTVLSGPSEGTKVRLEETRTVIGRDTSADITIDDDHISRRHAELEVLPGAQGIIVHDLGSKNGTYVRNCRIIDAYVDEYALVSLGEDTVIQLALEDSQITGYSRERLGELVDPRLRSAVKERGVQFRRPRIDENPTRAIPSGLKDDED